MADWLPDVAFTLAPGLPGLNPPHAAVWVRYLVRPSFANCRGVLRGLSPGAAGLVADQRLEPGTVLLLELPAPEPGEIWSRRAHVCSAEPCGPGRYLLRCRFTTSPDDSVCAANHTGLDPTE
jgi:hypothetical protein